MEARACLSIFRNIRDSLSKELDLPMESFENISEEYDRNKVKLSSHEMIMVEVKIISRTFNFLCDLYI